MVYDEPAHYSGQIGQKYLRLSPLPAYIIEEIRKREERRNERPRIRPTLPLPPAVDPTQDDVEKKGTPDRGVIIIDLGGDTIDSII